MAEPASASGLPSAREVLVATAALALLGAFAYGWFVFHGGLYADDWANAAGYRFADPPRYWSSVANFQSLIGGRPVMALLLPIPPALFGVEPGLHLGMALALGIATSSLFYVLLRTLGLALLPAGSIAGLALLFPWSDSIRLWSTASLNSTAVCLFLAGLIVALRGLDTGGRRGAAIHAGAALLYVLSVLTYEVCAAAALLAGLLYIGRAPISRVAGRWLVDVVVVLGALLYSLTSTVAARHVGSIAERVSDIGAFLRESLILLASAILPAGSLSTPVEALVLLAVVAVFALALVRARRRDDPALRASTNCMVVAAVAIGAAYFMFLGSHLHPLDPGIDSRINVFAGLGYAVLVYAVAAAASGLIFGRTALARGATIVIVAAIAIGYGVRLARDEMAWRDAAVHQREILGTAHRLLPDPPRGSALLTFGFPYQAAPEVPVFNKVWDLTGALQLQWGDPTVRGYPIYGGVEVRCGERLRVAAGGSYGVHRLGYAHVFFIRAGGGEKRVRSRGECRTALRRFRPAAAATNGPGPRLRRQPSA